MLDNGIDAALDYHALNAMLNLYDDKGHIRFDADRMAARQYFLQHVNQNTVFFHSLDEKLGYLVDEAHYTAELYDDLGLTENVKAFLHYNANKALQNLGYETLFPAQSCEVKVLGSQDHECAERDAEIRAGKSQGPFARYLAG